MVIFCLMRFVFTQHPLVCWIYPLPCFYLIYFSSQSVSYSAGPSGTFIILARIYWLFSSCGVLVKVLVWMSCFPGVYFRFLSLVLDKVGPPKHLWHHVVDTEKIGLHWYPCIQFKKNTHHGTSPHHQHFSRVTLILLTLYIWCI